MGVRLPTSNRLIYAYFLDLESGNFVPWENLVPSTASLSDRSSFSRSEPFGGGREGGGGEGQRTTTRSQRTIMEELVPTVDTIRYSFFTALFACNGTPVLLTGEIFSLSSCGVTSLLPTQTLTLTLCRLSYRNFLAVKILCFHLKRKTTAVLLMQFETEKLMTQFQLITLFTLSAFFRFMSRSPIEA